MLLNELQKLHSGVTTQQDVINTQEGHIQTNCQSGSEPSKLTRNGNFNGGGGQRPC